MKIELATIVCSKQEIPWLDFGLESILEKTKNDISTTLYLARYSDEMFEACCSVANKYNISLEVRGDNSPLQYINETKYRGFDVNGADCVMSLQPDVVFMKKDVFDDHVKEASDHFNSTYYICESTAHPDDIQPMGVTIHTKLGWDRLGCEDINFYPQAGGEHDYHRRCYLEYGLDPQDKQRYFEYFSGTIAPEWTYRIRAEHLLHLEKNWNQDPRLGGRTGNQYKLLDYSLEIFGKAVLFESYLPYYILKWGESVPGERYIHPFNNPEYPRKIQWEQSENPYPNEMIPSLRGLII